MFVVPVALGSTIKYGLGAPLWVSKSSFQSDDRNRSLFTGPPELSLDP